MTMASAFQDEPGSERVIAIAVAEIEPITAALVPPGTDQTFNVGFLNLTELEVG